MKNASILAALLWTAAVVWLALTLTAPAPPSSRPPPAIPTDTAAAAAGDVMRAEQSLQRLLAPTPREPLPSPLLALAAPLPPPAEIPRPLDTTLFANPAEATTPPERSVSFVFVGGEFRRALVNGQYVHTGATLADGGRVVGIDIDSVTVQDHFGRHTLQLSRDAAVDGSSSTAFPARR
jgi:hypothetical protein